MMMIGATKEACMDAGQKKVAGEKKKRLKITLFKYSTKHRPIFFRLNKNMKTQKPYKKRKTTTTKKLYSTKKTKKKPSQSNAGEEKIFALSGRRRTRCRFEDYEA